MSVSKRYLFQICFIVAIGGFLFAFDRSIISGALPFRIVEFQSNPFMEGWFVSSALLESTIVVAFSGKLGDDIGRNKMLIVSAGLLFVAALGSMIVANLFWLILLHIVGGLGIGVAFMVCPFCISEISLQHIRDKMVAFYQLVITPGIVAANFLNTCILQVAQQQTVVNWFHSNITAYTCTWRSCPKLIPDIKGKLPKDIQKIWQAKQFNYVMPNTLA